MQNDFKMWLSSMHCELYLEIFISKYIITKKLSFLFSLGISFWTDVISLELVLVKKWFVLDLLHAVLLNTFQDWKKTTSRILGWHYYKTIGSYVSCAFMGIWSTWKVLRAARVAEQLLPCVPHIPMDAHWHMNQLLIDEC